MPSNSATSERLIIASNRLPIRLVPSPDDGWECRPGSGGLVSAMVPVLRHRGGTWVGWSGLVQEETTEQTDEIFAEFSRNFGYTILPVSLSARERDEYYLGFSNEVVWPTFHDLPSLCNFDPDYWRTYLKVNERFAQVIAAHGSSRDYVWIQDYHLMHVGEQLRRMGAECSAGFFLHIPFPPLDMFLKIPWRLEILRALLEFELIGFQTARDRRNFLHAVKTLVRESTISGRGHINLVRIGKRRVRVGNFPISIDFEEFSRQAASNEAAEAAWYIHEGLADRQIILGIDRLDYTKGIPYRLNAFRNALERYPELRGKVSLVQVVVPSRTRVLRYQELRTEIERMVGEINGRFTESRWIPVHYLYRELSRTELLGYYRAAEIALITPLKDGMNLIAKEYCAVKEEGGVLILSEFAGAASELQNGALLVNPYHIEEMADSIHRAFHMTADERSDRMQRLRRVLRRHDIFHWVDSYLNAAFSKNLSSFPPVEEYVPRLKLEPL